jgi:septal ring factor EnvC (AmiA/AmiB activator)
MPELAFASQSSSAPWRPNLIPLFMLMTAACTLTAYFLVDTYFFREPTAKYAKDGTAFILRLREPLDQSLAIKAGGARLIQALAQVQQQSTELKARIAERMTTDQTYRTEIAAFMGQLEDAEQMIASLKKQIAELQQVQAQSPASGGGTANAQRITRD